MWARLLLQRLAQAEHLVDLAVHQYDVPGVERLDELGGLWEVRVR